ncbi:MAG TPA: phosphonopyruvate decarboxylase, partial [Gammaproteobacteria bacterium]
MIEAPEFIAAARRLGYAFYAGVPCSLLKSFINRVIEDPELTYVSAANEGDAVAACAGAYLGGVRGVAMMQNSGLGNAISPLASLTDPFEIPVLLIVTLRGDPELKDEPQHDLMGRATPQLLETLEIPWTYFPTEASEIDPALHAAHDGMTSSNRPFAFVMRRGSLAPGDELDANTIVKASSAAREIEACWRSQDRGPARSDVLRRIIERTAIDESLVLAATGYTGRELSALDDRANQLYMVGSMGCLSSLGLGLATTRPERRTVLIDGDGATLMRMGNLATVGTYAGNNLVHFVLDNEVHDSTGGQATVSSAVSFAAAAKACGYSYVIEGNDVAIVDRVLEEADSGSVDGPLFAHIKISPGTLESLPR